jgi:putative hydrolase of the HAD superfamily
MQEATIKNIIFDLGGVFMNIDFAKTEQAFRNLGITHFSSMFTQHHANDLFEELETGKRTPAAFYASFREATNCALTDEQIKDAWNALLLDFPVERLDWLEKIQQRYKIFLFSNTNLIHYIAFMEIYRNTTDRKDFDDFFIKAYYSHEIGFRKPYVDAYRYILKEQNLLPNETLFIDDTLKNIVGAQEAGLQTIHLQAPLTVLDLNL